MLICSRCGAQNQTPGKFCATCGAALAPANPPAPPGWGAEPPRPAPPPYGPPPGPGGAGPFITPPPAGPAVPPPAWGAPGPQPPPNYPSAPPQGPPGWGAPPNPYAPPPAAPPYGSPPGNLYGAPPQPPPPLGSPDPGARYGAPPNPVGAYAPPGAGPGESPSPFGATTPDAGGFAGGANRPSWADPAPPVPEDRSGSYGAPHGSSMSAPNPLGETRVSAAPAPVPAARDPEHVEPDAPRVLAGFLINYGEGSHDVGRFWPVYQGRNTVGRKEAAPNLDVEIDHATTSSRHAVIYASARPARMKLEDPGSTNGTFVNEQRLAFGTKHELSDGDSVRFGGYTVIVKII